MNFNRAFIFFFIGLVIVFVGLQRNGATEDPTQVLLNEISFRITQEIKALDVEAAQLLQQPSMDLSTVSHSFFVMDSSRVVLWNKNEFLPDLRTVQSDFSIRLLQWPRGIFLLKKWPVNSETFLLGVIPFQNRYKINNRYLISGWNKEIFTTQDVAIREITGEGYPFIWQGKEIFKLAITSNAPQRTAVDWWSLAIISFGILILITGCYQTISVFHQRRKFEIAFVGLLIFFIGGRTLMLQLFSSPDIPLFDPSYFASSSYNRSVGDLFLNTLCITVPIVYLFYNFHRFSLIKKMLAFHLAKRSAMAVVLILLGYFSVLLPFLFIETIFHNSSITLDITRTLSFDELRIFSFLSVIIACICAFMLVHVFARLVLGIINNHRIYFPGYLAIAIALFLLYSFAVDRNYLLSLLVASGYLLLIWIIELPKNLKRTTYVTFIYLFVAIVAFSLLGSLSIKKFVLEDKVNSQFRFANAFLTDRDYLGEYLLGESILRISNDPFIQTRLGSPFLSKAVVRQKVKQVYLNAYFDKYDIQIHLFNPNGNSFDNSTSLGFTELITNFQQKATKTNYEGLYFLKNSSEEATKRYLAVIPVNRFGMVTGYVVLDLSLKRVIPRNVFPELLLDDRFIQYFKNRDFSYAFFNENQITSSFGDFNFEKNFEIDQLANAKLYNEGISDNDYIHVGVEDEQKTVTVVSSPSYSFFNLITNFSFLFIIGLFIILIGLLVYGANTLYQRRELNYSARIQLYVYLAFILPLVMVSATTLGLINRSAESQLKEEYVEKSKTIGERFAPLIDAFLKNGSVPVNDIENQLIDLAKLANVDASVFSASGVLMASSQPLIYEDRIMSVLIDHDALVAIAAHNEQSYVGNEQIGSLSYNSSYYGMRSPESGELIGILSLPFFESAYSLEKTRISVMSNIINIFCVVFILFSILSFFAVRWLTFPLEFITRTLRRTTFTESNKPLVWHANDEIGLMVNEYNKMVENLEQSRIEISRIQKESAWREIAKQVAHEVKNPLTPMKLTLQQMERALLTDSLSKDKTEKSVQTLLQQVEILNDIAASFSAFARMPAPILQKVELTSLLKRVVDLHSDYQEGTVKLILPDQPVYIMGDDQLLSRVFSNIILNALQSGEEGSKIEVIIRLSLTSKSCIISISDNGKGIDPELGEKIFLPHFSTKKSGSGLGLAIARQGIEQNGGSIRFETQAGKGTVFYVEIKIADR